MIRVRTLVCACIASFLAAEANAEECSSILEYGIYDTRIENSLLDSHSSSRSMMCSQFQSNQEKVQKLNFSGRYKLVSAAGASDSRDSHSLYEAMCRFNEASQSTLEIKESFVRTASATVFAAYEECLKQNENDIQLEYSISSSGDNISIHVRDTKPERWSAGHGLRIERFSVAPKQSDAITCTADAALNQPLPRTTAEKAYELVGNELVVISCEISEAGGEVPDSLLLKEHVISLDTNKGSIGIEVAERRRPPSPKGLIVHARADAHNREEVAVLYFEEGESHLYAFNRGGNNFQGCELRDGKITPKLRLPHRGSIVDGPAIRRLGDASPAVQDGHRAICSIVGEVYDDL